MLSRLCRALHDGGLCRGCYGIGRVSVLCRCGSNLGNGGVAIRSNELISGMTLQEAWLRFDVRRCVVFYSVVSAARST
jgi:hypothetical protein